MAMVLFFLGLLLLSVFVPFIFAYSPAGFIYRCPVTFANLGFISPYGVTYCGTGSLFHYYICCDYNPMECCLQLEPWVIIALVVVAILGLLGCIGCCAICLIAGRK